VAVLVSGSGTNLQALLDDPVVGPRITLVISDRPGAYALSRAEALGVPAMVLAPGPGWSRDQYEGALLAILREHGVEALLLAGFMRLLGADVIHAFPNAVLNIHPALLPAFPGMHAERQALDWGVRVTGVTVHLVDEEVDHGPVVLQEPVIVLPDDDEASLHARVQEVEHRLYPRAARLLLEGRLKVEGRRVHILEDAG
jgi:phosphoribosylglycinamide formyltransferase-1